ncbi:MAG: GguC protein [Acidobacteriaceae bacterium]|nr:GguC protein [Acidobacteriaceae bacterium]MBV9938700.1 GguC protein [Acidobacteriaceae bacterium]
MRLVQIARGSERRVGAVDGSQLVLLSAAHAQSIYQLACRAIQSAERLTSSAENALSDEILAYDEVYEGASDWRLLPSFDHPHDPAYCMVSGTGLTHKKSAENRAAMHKEASTEITDSMRMYQMGIEGGAPEPGQIGVQPEWFYKGDGSILRAHGEILDIPAYAEDGGEEPEIAGAYLISPAGEPLRVGFTVANEFSDHKMEKKNYLYLAHSKLRNCSIGPELSIGDVPFEDIPGTVGILRDGQYVWRKEIWSGGKNMCHSLPNLEHHHFKYETHRRPGDVHIHVLGADAFSFGDGLRLNQGDIMEVSFPQFGRPLRNRLKIQNSSEVPVSVRAL